MYLFHSSMNIKGSFFSFLLLVCFIKNVEAQYKSGFIVSNEGDTTRGYIQYLDWNISPEFILFRDNVNVQGQRFYADQLSAFSIDSTHEHFVGKKIGILDIYRSDEFGISPSMVPTKYKFVFLQTVLRGPEASLYKYVNSGVEEHYFIETPILFQELLNYSYYERVRGTTYHVKREDYKRQLTSICSNSIDFKSKLPNYSEKELIRYLEKYNSCFLGETIRYRSPPSPAILDAMAGIGYEKLLDKMSCTAGVRINFPKKNYSRFIRASLNLIPGVYRDAEEITALRGSFGIGRYFGGGDFLPYLFVSCDFYSNKSKVESSILLTANAGISYRRRFEIEIGHWNNFFSLLGKGEEKEPFFLPVGLHFHYYPNFKRK